MRVKVTVLNYMSLASRITPAGAGKRLPAGTIVRIDKDHPRRCG
ncbi:conserved hypothetical protein [Pseudolactococcus piscium]|nr:conserved hypothetical protein [Lactococcus piscium]